MSDGPRLRFGRNILAGAATSIVLTAAVGGGLWLRSDRHEAASPVAQAPAATGRPVALSVPVSHPRSSYTPFTIYIVGSDDQAETLSAGFSDANVIRLYEGESPLLDKVVVASSDEAAAAIVAAETEANRILVAEFGVENRIVDLRR